MGKSPVICESMGIVKQNTISESGRIVKFRFLFPLPNFPLELETKRRGLREDFRAYSILQYGMYARILLLSTFISSLGVLRWAHPMGSCSREISCVVRTRPDLLDRRCFKSPSLYHAISDSIFSDLAMVSNTNKWASERDLAVNTCRTRLLLQMIRRLRIMGLWANPISPSFCFIARDSALSPPYVVL